MKAKNPSGVKRLLAGVLIAGGLIAGGAVVVDHHSAGADAHRYIPVRF